MVDGDRVGAGPAEFIHIPKRLTDHQMDIQGQTGDGANSPHDGKAKGNIWNKLTVHHVYMHRIGAREKDLVEFTA